MAAFSYQELPYVLSPEMMMMKLSSSSSSTTTNNSPLLSPSCCFSDDQSHLLDPSYPEPIFGELQFQYPFEDIVNFQQEQLKPIDFSLHENEPHVTAKQSNQMNPVTNKRKPKGNGNKDVRGVRSKKQKKCSNEGVKEEDKEEEEDDDEKDKNKMKEQKKSGQPAKEAPKGYIHVRARRGQATDSHSLAERVRREKISERMKFLQSLVPGCDKVTGKATMLDEIINYVQSLQSQVEFLSMKLASLSPMVYSFGVDLDHLLLEQQGLNSMTPQCSPSTTQTPPCAPVTTVETTGIAGPLVGAPTVFQQQVQRGANPPCLEDNVVGSLYWGMTEQGGSDPINQPGFYNNNNNLMYSF